MSIGQWGTNEELEERLFSENPPTIVLVNYNRLLSRLGIFLRYLRHLGECKSCECRDFSMKVITSRVEERLLVLSNKLPL